MEDPIAIIGASCRLAGEADSINGLWDMLSKSRAGHGQVPEGRWDAEAWFHPDPDRKGALAAKSGFFLKQDVASFDAPFFSVTPKEAAGMDPQKRLLLEVCYEALEIAGIPIEQMAGSMTGVYVGCMTNDFEILSTADIYDQPHMTAAGSSEAMTANRVSWFFDFRGPSLTLDTACSSSLYALHLACQSLKVRETDMNMVAGVNLMLHPRTSTQLTAMHMLSPDGTSHSFDDRANGYGRGEGIGCLIVKRLSDAVRDGDVIRAVIRGSAINVDGKTPSVTMPSSNAQADLIRLAYKQADLPLTDTQYIELHGTGTPLGDPIELAAIASTFGASVNKNQLIHVGSIKPNVGHTEGCAGLAGVFKAILSLEKGQILPTIGVETINPKLRFNDWNLSLPRDILPWPTQGSRRISVNSFGFGGANAHVILDDAYHYLKDNGIQAAHASNVETTTSQNEGCTQHQAGGQNGTCNGADVFDTDNNINGHHEPSGTNGTHETNGTTNGIIDPKSAGGPPQLFVYSAKDQASLQRAIEAHELFVGRTGVRSNDETIDNVAWTLAQRRSVFDHRAFAVASSLPELHDQLRQGPRKFKRVSGQRHGIVFILTGQGAQWAGMGKELLNMHSVFTASIERSTTILHTLSCSFSLWDEIAHPSNDTNIDSPEYSQPICTAIQVGLVDLLRSWGIVPKAVVGHSSGEIAAAYAAGIIGHEDAIKVAYFRGIYSLKASQGPRKGAMLAAGISEDDASQVLADVDGRVVAACVNSPKSVTLSGDADVIDRLEKTISGNGQFARRLRVSTAYHSPHMRDVAEGCLDSMKISGLSAPKETDTLMFSSVTGDLIAHTEVDASYWIRNMCQPVKFSQATSQLLTYSAKPGRGTPFGWSGLIEVGPHAALKAPLTQIMESIDAKLPKDMPYTSVLVRKEDAVVSALKAAGTLWAQGITISLEKVNRKGQSHYKPKPIPHLLPTYSWNHEKRYWYEPRNMEAERLKKLPRTDLLGFPVDNQNPFEPQWKNYLRVAENPWVEDHVITGTTLYPGAGMLIMVIEAAQQIAMRDNSGGSIRGVDFRDVFFERGMVLPAEGAIQTLLSVKSPVSDGALYSFAVFSNQGGGPWTKHCFGEFDILYERREANDQGEEGNNVAVGRDPIVFDWKYRTEVFKSIKELPSNAVDVSKLYSDLASVGMEYGETFQNLTTLDTALDGSGCYGTVKVPDTASVMPFGFEYPHVIHPATLDSIFHLMVATVSNGESMSEAAVPYRLKRMFIANQQPQGEGAFFHGYATRNSTDSSGQVSANLVVSDDKWDEPKVIVDGLVMRQVTSGSGGAGERSDGGENDVIQKRCTRIEWKLDPEIFVQTQSVGKKIAACHIEQVRSLGNWLELECHKASKLSVLVLGEGLDIELLNQLIPFLPGGGSPYRGISHLTVIEKNEPDLGPWRATLEAIAPKSQAHVEYEKWNEEAGPLSGKTYNLIVTTGSSWNPDRAESFLVPGLTSGGRILVLSQKQDEQDGGQRSSKIPSDGDSIVACTIPLNNGSLDVISRRRTLDLKGPFGTTVAIILPSSSSSGASLAFALASELESGLQTIGLTSQRLSIADFSPGSTQKHDYVISFLDLTSAGFVASWNAEEFSAFKRLINNTANLFWVTRGAQMLQPSKEGLPAAPTTGLLRVLRNEMPFVALTHLDLSGASWSTSTEPSDTNLASIIFNSWQISVDDSVPSEEKDREYAEHGGNLLVPRSIAEPVVDLARATSLGTAPPILQTMSTASTIGPIMLDVSSDERRNWAWKEESGTLEQGVTSFFGPEDVEVRVTSSSVPIGAASHAEGLANLATQVTGIVTRVGDLISRLPGNSGKLAVGDDVIVLKVSSGLHSHVKQHASLVHKLPSTPLSPAAATGGWLYLTAAYILEKILRISAGESLFVHNGIEPLGQALLKLALRRSVRVFTSATSQVDRQWLIDTYGVHEADIVDPRGGDMTAYFLDKTAGLGIDAVITSSRAFTGRKDTGSWTADFGQTVVLLGKESASSAIAFAPSHSGSLTILDPTSLWNDGRQLQALNSVLLRSPDLLETIAVTAQELADSALTTVLSVSQLDDIATILQNPNTTTGILAITFDSDAAVPTVVPPPSKLELDENGTYILAGGLGSLGMRIALLMVYHGAKHIVLLSRSGAKNKAKYEDHLAQLAAAGCQVDILTCDVTQEQDIQSVFSWIATSSPHRSIRGIVQCAMVLADSVFDNMTHEQWTTAYAPKVAGTWHLHNLLPRPGDVDFFIMLSSIVSIIGNVSQANYAAGNAWMDALAHYRRSLGLPATSLNVGLVLDSHHDINGASLQDGGYLKMFSHMASVSTTLDELEIGLIACMRESRRLDQEPGEATPLEIPAQFVYGMTDLLPSKDQWTVDRKFLHRLEDSHVTQDGQEVLSKTSPGIGGQLGAVASLHEAITIIQECLTKMLAPSLGIQPIDINFDKPLYEAGVDSFKAVEIRNYVFRELKSELSVFEILSPKSLGQITGIVASKSQFVPALLRTELVA